MSEIITEALMEMHFHSALINYFRRKYGYKCLRVLKPSQRQEAWVGFDQAWVPTSLTTRELISELKEKILNKQTSAGSCNYSGPSDSLLFYPSVGMTWESSS